MAIPPIPPCCNASIHDCHVLYSSILVGTHDEIGRAGSHSRLVIALALKSCLGRMMPRFRACRPYQNAACEFRAAIWLKASRSDCLSHTEQNADRHVHMEIFSSLGIPACESPKPPSSSGGKEGSGCTSARPWVVAQRWAVLVIPRPKTGSKTRSWLLGGIEHSYILSPSMESHVAMSKKNRVSARSLSLQCTERRSPWMGRT